MILCYRIDCEHLVRIVDKKQILTQIRFFGSLHFECTKEKCGEFACRLNCISRRPAKTTTIWHVKDLSDGFLCVGLIQNKQINKRRLA